MAAGLLDNKQHPNGKLFGYDLFAGYSLRAFEKDIRERGLTFDNDLALFDWQTESVNRAVDRFQINLNESPEVISRHGPAELVHIDAAKSLSLWQNIFGQIVNLIIPGHTIWVFQDFERARLPFQIYAIGALLEYGEIIGGAYFGTIYFVLNEQPPFDLIDQVANDSFSVEEKLTLIAGVLTHIRRICPDVLGSFEYIGDIENAASAYVHLLAGDPEKSRSYFDLFSNRFQEEPANKVYKEEIQAGRIMY